MFNTKFDYRECPGCPYFEKEQEAALNRNGSAWDAASDMWAYTEKCWEEHLCPCKQRGETTLPTIEDHIQKLRDILEEATESEDAVCYVTSNDAEALKAAIKALIAYKPKYVLSACDSFSIDTSIYDSLEEAHDAMKRAYDLCAPEGFDDEDEDSDSFCGELNAVLFTGETVYTWDITEVK